MTTPAPLYVFCSRCYVRLVAGKPAARQDVTVKGRPGMRYLCAKCAKTGAENARRKDGTK